MSNLKEFLLYIIVVLFLSGCAKDEPSPAEYVPKFVVEGWIENDAYPTVILTKNVPYFADLDSAGLADVILRYARITVSDGVRSEVLAARKDTSYFPAYVYRGSEIKGEIGKKYKLTIEYGSVLLESETEIPPPVPLDSVNLFC